MFAHANVVPSCLYLGVLSGDQDTSVAGWLQLSHEALESKAVVAAWAEFREQLHADPTLHIRRGDTLRARKLASGQGRTRFPSARRGPSKAEQWGYRHVLRRGLEVIAGLPGTRVGTAHGRGMSATATTDALLAKLSARHNREGTAALAVIRTHSAASAWYALTPAPSPAAPHACDELDGLMEAAEFVAHCAYQHRVRRHHRRFLWEWFPELLPDADAPIEL